MTERAAGLPAEAAAGSAAAPAGAQAGGSLGRRLLLAAVLWVGCALLVAAWALTALFREHVEAELAARATAHLDELSAALARDADGAIGLEREPSEPLFRQPYSGLYWVVDRGGDGALRSRSLWDAELALPPAAHAARPGDAVLRSEAAGPRGQPLVLWSRRVQPAGAAAPLTVAVAADVSRIEAMTRSFARTLAVSLALLAAGLLGAALLQVKLGLAPLARLRADLLALRSGRARRVAGRYPSEVQPLVEDLNGLLDDRAASVERARSQTGNLAHALKTPLAVIANAAGALPPAERALIEEQTERMRRQVELHLARARAAATAGTRGPGTPVAPALEALRRTLERLYRERALALVVTHDGAAVFRGDAQDLQEMLGNLLDNACKWAATRIEVRVAAAPGRVACEIEDDGPGIAPEQHARVLQRGQRLDESRPGAGLGLQIVDELARLHGGSLQLGRGRLGGLLARLELPAPDG